MKNPIVFFTILTVCYFTFLGDWCRQGSKSLEHWMKGEQDSYYQEQSRE